MNLILNYASTPRYNTINYVIWYIYNLLILLLRLIDNLWFQLNT